MGAVLADLGHREPGVVEIDRPVTRSQAALEAQEVHRRRTDEVRDEHAGGPVVNLLRRTDLFHAPLVHDRDLVGHRHRLEMVVGDIDRGRLDAIVQVAQLAAHHMEKLGVERAQRLVHQEGLRTAHHGSPERYAVAVAAGELRCFARHQMLDPQHPRGLLHPLANLVPRHTLALQREADVLPDIHMRIEREQLEHERDVAGGGTVERDVLPVEQDLALGRKLEAGDHAQGGGLAAAGRAEQREERAVVDGEARPFHRGELIERLAKIFDADLSHGAIPESG